MTLRIFDTHALIWLSEGSSRLGTKARETAERALTERRLAVSAASFWEAANLRRGGRINLYRPIAPWRDQLLRMGIREIPIDGALAIAAGELGHFHSDPADRFIVASASSVGAILVTADSRILEWDGELRTHDARV